MFHKWFDPAITWLIGRNLREVKIWLNQFPELPAIETDLNFCCNFWIKVGIALYQLIKMMCKQQNHCRIPCKDLKLRRIEIIPWISITHFSGIRMSDVELGAGNFLTEHHTPGEIMTLFVPDCPSRIKRMAER